jgi:uncharacterized protein YqfA (UPF0365 family)
VHSEVLDAWLIADGRDLQISNDRRGIQRWLTAEEQLSKAQADAERAQADAERAQADAERERQARHELEARVRELEARLSR